MLDAYGEVKALRRRDTVNLCTYFGSLASRGTTDLGGVINLHAKRILEVLQAYIRLLHGCVVL